MMDKEKTVNSRIIFDGHAVKLRVDDIVMPDGRETTREIVEHTPCITVVPVDENDNVLLVKQYRKAIEKDLLEVPAGGIDGNETPEEATLREMQEETGFIPGRLIKMGGFYTSPGYSNEYLYLFVAFDLAPSRLFAEDTEGIELVKVPVTEIPALLASDKVEDAKTFAALYMYLDWCKNNR